MRTRRTLLEDAVERLTTAGIANAQRNAEWMLCEALGCSRATLYAGLSEDVPDEGSCRFEEMLSRRQAQEPLQYILGYTEFYGLQIAVTPDVLIPRPETEQVVELALEHIREVRSPRVLDVGTGSGCIALAVKSQRNEASVWGCDVSPRALQIARDNASTNSLEVKLIELDALSSKFAQDAPGDLDLMVSNPPYVPESEMESLPEDVREYEPLMALIAPSDPLVFYRKLADDGHELLKSGGAVVFETHADFGRHAEEMLRSKGYEHVDLRRDYAGRSRILIGRRPG